MHKFQPSPNFAPHPDLKITVGHWPFFRLQLLNGQPLPKVVGQPLVKVFKIMQMRKFTILKWPLSLVFCSVGLPQNFQAANTGELSQLKNLILFIKSASYMLLYYFRGQPNLLYGQPNFKVVGRLVSHLK